MSRLSFKTTTNVSKLNFQRKIRKAKSHHPANENLMPNPTSQGNQLDGTEEPVQKDTRIPSKSWNENFDPLTELLN